MTSGECEREGVREAVALCGRVRARLRVPPPLPAAMFPAPVVVRPRRRPSLKRDADAEAGRAPLFALLVAPLVRARGLARARAWKRGLRGRPPPKEGAGEPEPMVLRTA